MKHSQNRFADNETYLPITTQQFEDLTNEILTQINEVSAPHALNADYVAQILMSAIHAMKHEVGIVNKSDLFDSCINRISCHLTYNVVDELQKKLKAAQPASETPPETAANEAPPAVSLVPDPDAEKIG